MNFLQHIFLMPYASLWIPGGIFLFVVGGVYVFTRRNPSLNAVDPQDGAFLKDGVTPFGTVVRSLANELRQSGRRQGNPIEIFLAFPEYKDRPERACLIDRSLGGMRLVAPHNFEVGAIVSIRPVTAQDMVPWLDLEVRSCRPSDGEREFVLGCQFVKPPPYSIMMLYG